MITAKSVLFLLSLLAGDSAFKIYNVAITVEHCQQKSENYCFFPLNLKTLDISITYLRDYIRFCRRVIIKSRHRNLLLFTFENNEKCEKVAWDDANLAGVLTCSQV